MKKKVDSLEMDAICDLHGKTIKTPHDNLKLIKTIAKLESSYGQDCRPRLEHAYYPSGIYYKKSALLQKGYDAWGPMVSMSYGPFQIMWVVAVEFSFSIYTDPEELNDGRVSGYYVARYLSNAFSSGAKSIDLLLASYNGGLGAIQRQNEDVKRYVSKGLQIFNSLN